MLTAQMLMLNKKKLFLSQTEKIELYILFWFNDKLS